MDPAIHKTSDVFGIQRDIPKNYVTRSNVDDLFVESLTQDKHIVVYGSSKQGKTSLRKYNLNPDEYITITCSNTTTLSQLQASILKEAGYTIEQSSTRTVNGESKINAKVSGGLNLGVARIGSAIATDMTDSEELQTLEVSLELDPSDTNDIIRALREIEFGRLIVLEDFHYLQIDIQEAFSYALKAYHENSNLTFIIVGVWLDENRLIQYNGDLTGRVLAVNADAWSDVQLGEVIEKGEAMLNLKIADEAKSLLITGCFESVYIVQDACFRICESAGIHQTASDLKSVGANIDVRSLVQEIVGEQSARYEAFLSAFSGGFQETRLEMYKWVLLPVLMAESIQLEQGISWSIIRRIVDENHPDSPINPGNLTQALAAVASLQVKTKISPIIIDYDQTRRLLNVVDRGFLVWLDYQDRAEVRDSVSLPRDPKGIIPRRLA